MNIARDDLSKRIIHWIQFLKPSLASVTDKEIGLLEEVFKLPDKFLTVPFSSIPKRLYCERMSIEPLALQRLIVSLFKKGYLIKDEYEEFDVLPLLKNTMLKGLSEAVKIRFELDWILDGEQRHSKINDNGGGLRYLERGIAEDDKSGSTKLSIKVDDRFQEQREEKTERIINETIIPTAHNVKESNELDIPQKQRIITAPIIQRIETIEEQKQRMAEYRARKKNEHV
jgi:hypothetical protein